MGTFEVEIQVRNWQNRFLPEEERGEDIACKALVDSSAVQLSLPVERVERLKLMELGQVRVYTADGGEHEYRVMGIAESRSKVELPACRSSSSLGGQNRYLEPFPWRRWIGTSRQ